MPLPSPSERFAMPVDAAQERGLERVAWMDSWDHLIRFTVFGRSNSEAASLRCCGSLQRGWEFTPLPFWAPQTKWYLLSWHLQGLLFSVAVLFLSEKSPIVADCIWRAASRGSIFYMLLLHLFQCFCFGKVHSLIDLRHVWHSQLLATAQILWSCQSLLESRDECLDKGFTRFPLHSCFLLFSFAIFCLAQVAHQCLGFTTLLLADTHRHVSLLELDKKTFH